jgi:D-2-hydroxyacid dehydrogenase (NADP+)
MAQIKVLVAVFREAAGWVLDDEYIQRIRAVDPQLDVVAVMDRKGFARELPAAEIVFGGAMTANLFATAARLQWIQATSAGVDNLLTKVVRDSQVQITTAAGVHAVQGAEHALALMLAFARQIHTCLRAQVQTLWAADEVRPALDELYEKTVGLVGLGAIAQEIARRCKAFGMRVMAVKRREAVGAANVDVLLGPDGLERLLAESDYVVLAVPLTRQTRHRIGRRELKRMKGTAVLINICRGEVVDEPALVEALDAGRLGGAGLDVFDEEPLSPSSPLWRMPNVIITPHVAGNTPRYWQRCTDLFCDNLRRYLAGQRLTNLVDKEAGY